jgi:hypothetical protein
MLNLKQNVLESISEKDVKKRGTNAIKYDQCDVIYLFNLSYA